MPDLLSQRPPVKELIAPNQVGVTIECSTETVYGLSCGARFKLTEADQPNIKKEHWPIGWLTMDCPYCGKRLHWTEVSMFSNGCLVLVWVFMLLTFAFMIVTMVTSV